MSGEVHPSSNEPNPRVIVDMTDEQLLREADMHAIKAMEEAGISEEEIRNQFNLSEDFDIQSFLKNRYKNQ